MSSKKPLIVVVVKRLPSERYNTVGNYFVLRCCGSATMTDPCITIVRNSYVLQSYRLRVRVGQTRAQCQQNIEAYDYQEHCFVL